MKLKNRIFVCFILFILASCGAKKSSVKEYVRNADSASIAFYATADSTQKIIIKDKTTIDKLGEYIDGTPMDPGKCTESGSIWFYEGTRKKMQVDFSMNGDCNYFSYMMNDQVYAKSMSSDATKYLNGIKEIALDTL